MKRNFVFVLLFFAFSSFSCFAQSSNNDQRIVGTWICTDTGNSSDSSYTLVFNTNGAGSYKRIYTDRVKEDARARGISAEEIAAGEAEEQFTYGISITGSLGSTSSRIHVKTLYFSPDGRTMIFDGKIYRKR